jgi:hypothetical protein
MRSFSSIGCIRASFKGIFVPQFGQITSCTDMAVQSILTYLNSVLKERFVRGPCCLFISTLAETIAFVFTGLDRATLCLSGYAVYTQHQVERFSITISDFSGRYSEKSFRLSYSDFT